jgi:hypothetical protein
MKLVTAVRMIGRARIEPASNRRDLGAGALVPSTIDRVDVDQRVVDGHAGQRDHAHPAHQVDRVAHDHVADDRADDAERDREQDHDRLDVAAEDDRQEHVDRADREQHAAPQGPHHLGLLLLLAADRPGELRVVGHELGQDRALEVAHHLGRVGDRLVDVSGDVDRAPTVDPGDRGVAAAALDLGQGAQRHLGHADERVADRHDQLLEGALAAALVLGQPDVDPDLVAALLQALGLGAEERRAQGVGQIDRGEARGVGLDRQAEVQLRLAGGEAVVDVGHALPLAQPGRQSRAACCKVPRSGCESWIDSAAPASKPVCQRSLTCSTPG